MAPQPKRRISRQVRSGKKPGQRAMEAQAKLRAEVEAEMLANPESMASNPVAAAYDMRRKAYLLRLQQAGAEYREARAKGPETEEAVRECIALMEDGVSIRAAAQQLGYNYSRINNAISRSPELKEAAEGLREQYAHARMRLLYDIVENEPDPVRARLLADCVKWELSKVLPKFYGDRVALEAQDGVTFSINMGKPADKAAIKR